MTLSNDGGSGLNKGGQRLEQGQVGQTTMGWACRVNRMGLTWYWCQAGPGVDVASAFGVSTGRATWMGAGHGPVPDRAMGDIINERMSD